MEKSKDYYLYLDLGYEKWYRCRKCGAAQTSVPPLCPVCHGLELPDKTPALAADPNFFTQTT